MVEVCLQFKQFNNRKKLYCHFNISNNSSNSSSQFKLIQVSSSPNFLCINNQSNNNKNNNIKIIVIIIQQQQQQQQQQYLLFSNPSPHSKREPLQQLNGSQTTYETSFIPMRFPSSKRESFITSQDESKRSILESNPQNQHCQQFGNLLYKIAKLFINTEYFEQFSLGKMYTRTECMFLQLKIQFCLLQSCIQIFQPSNPCLQECQVRLLNVKQTILQMADQYVQDPRFMSLFTNKWVLENIFEQISHYNYLAIHLINDYLNRDCNHPHLIILLDYLVILQQLLKRFATSVSWMEFEQRNNIAAIVQAPINPNPNKQQWVEICKIIYRDIVK
ncbi:unnamed protein product (macronuclear) [Paramecium tetraurelia]|uniref:Uncharacterized protein n=1 Tax=Paramecium tetraurelia TaxID=5888 RepID=A0C4Q7_PARTE|nr:uncharacterized protein GSPATT00006273001 [Paramecium tetraurelia]CAK65774.1 unnamed protein product [Paramecium tetraurelia]|eukprot:XP_001433171.1 hypothetical protein (macronuclear) [Paramecium tetraurelia strain d4-2]